MVLMLTAASAPGDRVSGLTLGADDYLAAMLGDNSVGRLTELI